MKSSLVGVVESLSEVVPGSKPNPWTPVSQDTVTLELPPLVDHTLGRSGGLWATPARVTRSTAPPDPTVVQEAGTRKWFEPPLSEVEVHTSPSLWSSVTVRSSLVFIVGLGRTPSFIGEVESVGRPLGLDTTTLCQEGPVALGQTYEVGRSVRPPTVDRRGSCSLRLP